MGDFETEDSYITNKLLCQLFNYHKAYLEDTGIESKHFSCLVQTTETRASTRLQSYSHA